MDRCHCGPEMEEAYRQLVEKYPEANLLMHDKKKEVNGWLRPPYWHCSRADLIDETGKVIASRDRHNLSVYSYSPSIDTTISLKDLQNHLFSDPDRPDAICFHFRNQYRHWEPKWGFSIPHNLRNSLSNSIKYRVIIDSSFNNEMPMVQSDYQHDGKSDDTYLFMGHFDHPSQVNDGLAGCISAYEIIRRLQGRNTRFSYRAFASVEIVGSVYYLDALGEAANNIRETLFLGFSGITSQMVYQQSFKRNSFLDRIVQHLLLFNGVGEKSIFNHRELSGNDENVFDSVGYEIPSGTLTRWPFPEYHTNYDNIEITNKEKIEEVINFGLRVIEVIENNYYLIAKYKGLPSLSNPNINLYLSPTKLSGVDSKASSDMEQFLSDLLPNERDYILKNPQILNQFMQNMVRLADGKNTILDLAEISNLPYHFILKYASLMKNKGLIYFSENPI